MAKYNVGHGVGYTHYMSISGNQTVISNDSRGDIRPRFELLSAHYSQLKGLNSSWTDAYREWVNSNSTSGVEGGAEVTMVLIQVVSMAWASGLFSTIWARTKIMDTEKSHTDTRFPSIMAPLRVLGGILSELLAWQN